MVADKIQLKTELRDPVSYTTWPLVLIGLLIAAAIGVFVYFYLKKKMASMPPKPSPVFIKHPMQIKQEFMQRLNIIEHEVLTGKITVREGYQRLSETARKYVFTATGIKVQTYTLEEIRALNMPQLYSLIQLFYEPEFALRVKTDVLYGIAATRKVIWEWN